MDDDSRADLPAALLAGTGLALSAVGVFAVPVLAIAGLLVSFLAWRAARPSYRVGRRFAVAGMVVAVLGLAAMVTRMLAPA